VDGRVPFELGVVDWAGRVLWFVPPDFGGAQVAEALMPALLLPPLTLPPTTRLPPLALPWVPLLLEDQLAIGCWPVGQVALEPVGPADALLPVVGLAGSVPAETEDSSVTFKRRIVISFHLIATSDWRAISAIEN
jgi:hypothetical protein